MALALGEALALAELADAVAVDAASPEPDVAGATAALDVAGALAADAVELALEDALDDELEDPPPQPARARPRQAATAIADEVRCACLLIMSLPRDRGGQLVEAARGSAGRGIGAGPARLGGAP